ncbi:MAG TPA: hypothetical protein PKA90_08405 [Ignavibacteria bacterium]|nr:hypothetical protein [Ignavibacteria bacterium]HMR40440.1 hypothetical protein [Ignavibacteria bacterium]
MQTEKSVDSAGNFPEDSSSEVYSQKEKLIIDKLKELFDTVEYKTN